MLSLKAPLKKTTVRGLTTDRSTTCLPHAGKQVQSAQNTLKQSYFRMLWSFVTVRFAAMTYSAMRGGVMIWLPALSGRVTVAAFTSCHAI